MQRQGDQCGTGFEAKRASKRFCSDQCRTRSSYERSQSRNTVVNVMQQKACERRGNKFDTIWSTKRFCTTRCSEASCKVRKAQVAVEQSVQPSDR
jgi:predicted nucleic acid-binding Zn ribbon protein